MEAFPYHRDFAARLPSARRYKPADFDVAPKVLGRGKFGTVFRAREKETRTVVVLKSIDKAAVRAEGVLDQLARETEVHCRLKHPHVIEMFAYFHDATKCYMVLEYANGGTLYHKLQSLPGKRMAESDAASIVAQVCRGLHYLHRHNVVHRDLKPENILLAVDPITHKTQVKLGDFGWSVAMKKDSIRRTLCGTVEYLPPEVADGSDYGFAFDMWTVGILAYEMLAGYSPFADPSMGEDQDQDAVIDRIRGGHFEVPSHVSPGAADLISKLLALDASARLGPAQVQQHPWIISHVGPYAPSPASGRVSVESIAPWPHCDGDGFTDDGCASSAEAPLTAATAAAAPALRSAPLVMAAATAAVAGAGKIAAGSGSSSVAVRVGSGDCAVGI